MLVFTCRLLAGHEGASVRIRIARLPSLEHLSTRSGTPTRSSLVSHVAPQTMRRAVATCCPSAAACCPIGALYVPCTADLRACGSVGGPVPLAHASVASDDGIRDHRLVAYVDQLSHRRIHITKRHRDVAHLTVNGAEAVAAELQAVTIALTPRPAQRSGDRVTPGRQLSRRSRLVPQRSSATSDESLPRMRTRYLGVTQNSKAHAAPCAVPSPSFTSIPRPCHPDCIVRTSAVLLRMLRLRRGR